MHLKRYDIIDVGEYKIIIDYAGSQTGELDITVLDELGDEIEGLYISNDEEYTDDEPEINLN
jgi:hypothetical protein